MTTLNIFRFDPSVDDAPYYEPYEVPATEGMSVLQGLHYIRENFAPISYDYSCRATGCGLCGMTVNGTPCFACCTPIEEDGSYTIEPLGKYPVIKDLFVDRSAVEERINSLMPQFIRTTPMAEPVQISQKSNGLTAVLQQCRDCGICMTVCPTVEMMGFGAYAGPEVLVKLATRYFDEREGAAPMRLQQAVSEGLFHCIECGTCTSVCPKGELIKVDEYPYSSIDHPSIFKTMKEDAEAAGLKPEEGATPTRPLTSFLQNSDYPDDKSGW